MQYSFVSDPACPRCPIACAAGVIRVVDPLPKSTLHASGLVTNIDLTELGVLHRVKTLMAPEAADIRAELCRLDMYGSAALENNSLIYTLCMGTLLDRWSHANPTLA